MDIFSPWIRRLVFIDIVEPQGILLASTYPTMDSIRHLRTNAFKPVLRGRSTG